MFIYYKRSLSVSRTPYTISTGIKEDKYVDIIFYTKFHVKNIMQPSIVFLGINKFFLYAFTQFLFFFLLKRLP